VGGTLSVPKPSLSEGVQGVPLARIRTKNEKCKTQKLLRAFLLKGLIRLIRNTASAAIKPSRPERDFVNSIAANKRMGSR